jgi:hypothetical protein
MVFRLAGGVTGFYHGEAPDRPEVPIRQFRGGCHAAARAAGGRVEKVVEMSYPGTFHSAVLASATGRVSILCHFMCPWIAFIEGDPELWHPAAFAEPPAWSAVFAEFGFTVLSRAVLDAPLSEADTTALTKADWSQIRSWRPASVGRLVFNSWD